MSDQYNRDSMELLAPYDFSDATERGNAEDAVAARLREMGEGARQDRQCAFNMLAKYNETVAELDKAEQRAERAEAELRANDELYSVVKARNRREALEEVMVLADGLLNRGLSNAIPGAVRALAEKKP